MNTTEIKKQKPKLVYIEAIRIIALFFVIFNHTNQRGYTHFTVYPGGSFQYWFAMLFSIIAGISVPLFFMISGIFLIDKEESISSVWKKRIPKYVITLLVFSLFGYLFYLKFDFSLFSTSDFLKKLYSGGVIIPYWFLYAYIAFLIGLPLLRKLIKNMDDQDFLYLIGIYILFNGIINLLQYRMSNGTVYINGSLNVSHFTSNVVFYPAIGYFLGKRKKRTSMEANPATGFALPCIDCCYSLYDKLQDSTYRRFFRRSN